MIRKKFKDLLKPLYSLISLKLKEILYFSLTFFFGSIKYLYMVMLHFFI